MRGREGERAYEHLLVIGLAAHQPELRIARGVGQLLEAAVGLVERVVRVHEAPLRIRRLVPLPDLLLQLRVLLLSPLRVELPVERLTLALVDGLGVEVLLVLVEALLILIVVLRVLIIVVHRTIVDEDVPAARLFRLRRRNILRVIVVVADVRAELAVLVDRPPLWHGVWLEVQQGSTAASARDATARLSHACACRRHLRNHRRRTGQCAGAGQHRVQAERHLTL